MSTTTQGIRDQWISDLCAHVADRSETVSWMVAVRYGSDAVTFGALTSSINDYRRIVGVQGMSLESALTGALLHTAPSLIDLESVARASAVDQMIHWLGREIVATPISTTRTLRSVG
ncbi:hypothetical protein L5G32_00490 [Gordonia sp. HY002]|uniref:hypothetical protein n=1 Tax=Gordonia zhenghanii TaxID=2911516 RepID=UPI001EF11875|nr:hypothetical protein [Gordonia zhenghanii]MCF8568744.1 hypothetical protein [Gordonia zhenghanii]MCF8607040.1 hypothetical protein [Gordonia zhenghanii]